MVPPTGRNSVEEYRRTREHSTAGVHKNPAEQHTHSHGVVNAVAGSSHKHTTGTIVGSPLVHGERKDQDGQGPAAGPVKVNFPPASDKASWKQANDTLSAIFEKSFTSTQIGATSASVTASQLGNVLFSTMLDLFGEREVNPPRSQHQRPKRENKELQALRSKKKELKKARKALFKKQGSASIAYRLVNIFQHEPKLVLVPLSNESSGLTPASFARSCFKRSRSVNQIFLRRKPSITFQTSIMMKNARNRSLRFLR